MKRRKKPKILKVRHHIPPLGGLHKDRKKESSRQACRRKHGLED